MLFHEQSFLLIFLPFVVLGYFLLIRYPKIIQHIFLLTCSLFFYGYYNLNHIFLIIFSILFNYNISSFIIRNKKLSKIALIIGLFSNILLLISFKYIDFIIYNFNFVFGQSKKNLEVELPLAISFFTFQQIAYLVDSKKGLIKNTNFIKYCLFIVFFPQLIAGPIVRFQQIINQLNSVKKQLKPENLLTGFCLFSFGLYKKHYLADGMKPIADSLFFIIDRGSNPSILESWIGSIAFGLQIYFDFSAYSDMAIGLALLFGIYLPLNFNSPYKSANITEFWRRWHITLSEFLRDYLYFPLGGNRKGLHRGIFNAMLVMILGGLWHGASWTFIAWGTYHGILIGLTHALKRYVGFNSKMISKSIDTICFNKFTTFVLVSIGWVFFRSENFQQARIVLESMFGLSGFDLSRSLKIINETEIIRFNGFLPNQELDITLLPMIPILLLIVWVMPNSNQILKLNPTKFSSKIPSKILLLVCGILFFFSIKISLENTVHEFLYFQF